MRKIGFLISQFPEMHETFILREFTALKKKEINFYIYSLKKCKDKIIHPEAKNLLGQTYYASNLEFSSFLYWLKKKPRVLCKILYFKVLRNLWPAEKFLKTSCVFLKSLYFARLMHKHNIHHLHAHWATMPTTGAEIINELLGIPFSFTAHAWDIYLSTKIDLGEKLKKATFAVTCTQANKNYLDNIQRNKLEVNYHGLDIKKFNFTEDSISIPSPIHLDNVNKNKVKIILAIGRLVEQKGFEYLIKACDILNRKNVNFQCILVGEGPLRKELENLRNKLGLKQYIQMPGSVDQEQIKKYFKKTAVFVVPSVIARNGDRDGIPNVLLEALAMGAPVIATKVSGIPEVIIHNKTGILVEPRNESALSTAISRMLIGQFPADNFRQNGRKMVIKKFDIDKNVEALISIFQKHEVFAK